MSVVGIDIGNLNTVVAVARNRGIDVITNEVSNRNTPTLVSFGDKQRYLGESAKTQEISNFKSTVSSLKRLIGRPFNDPDIEYEKQYINCDIVEGERGEVAAEVMYQDEKRIFSLTQITAMFLGQVRDFTQKEIKIPMTDCVLSCPGWYTDRQRRALADAAHIAGLNVLKLMNDLTAAALGYGITKTDLPDPTADPKQKPRNIIFVDLGNSSYQVAVVQYVKGKLVIKGTAYDRNLGGRDFDEVLVKHFIKEFDVKYKMNIRSSPKAVFRLRQGCEKVKKILSANAVTMLNVECLLDDKDVSARVERTDYEEWLKPLLSRIPGPIIEALKIAGVEASEIDAVELIGGSTRIPKVKEFLAEHFKGPNGENKLQTTMNQDEAVSRGCALQCAISSPVFKVREFSVQDWNGYPIEFNWDASLVPPTKTGEAPETCLEVFSLGNAIPSSKALTFHRALPESELNEHHGVVSLDINVNYTQAAVKERGLPFVENRFIGKFTIKGIRKLHGDPNAAGDGVAKATIKVKARLDGNQLVGLEQAQQIEEVLVADEPEKKEGEAMETDEAKEVAPVDIKAGGPPPKLKRVTRKHDLQIVAHTGGASGELIKEWHSLEGQMAVNDRLIIDTAEKRNQLEEFVYYARDKLDTDWSEFIKEDVRSALSSELAEMEDWLYGDGEDATKSVYVEKINQLKAKSDPVAQRYLEADERPRAEKQFREYVNSVILGLGAEDGRYEHIPKADLEKVSKECETKLNWLNDSIGKINEQPKHVTPKVLVGTINKEKENLAYFVNPIINRPKPAPKKEEPKKEEEGEAASTEEVPAEEGSKDKQVNEMDVD